MHSDRPPCSCSHQRCGWQAPGCRRGRHSEAAGGVRQAGKAMLRSASTDRRGLQLCQRTQQPLARSQVPTPISTTHTHHHHHHQYTHTQTPLTDRSCSQSFCRLWLRHSSRKSEVTTTTTCDGMRAQRHEEAG